MRTMLGAPRRTSLPPTFRAPPPWEPPAAEFSATQLPASKALCAVEEMRQHAFMAMAQVTEPDSVVYYTDGSADPDSGRTGAAAITRGAETELVAILLALEHAQHRRERTVVLHTDSRTGLQALQQPYPSDNVGLVTAILGSLQSLAAQGAAGGDLLSSREARAALIVRHTPTDLMLRVLRAAPPPR
ncbi:hypothetical protein O3P69_010815 [Scylla paramamosain]|uniref:RNase H type-1 domain-containing protein n=1 Tax=Scylla paramamosain TaxID=85552 RepID=A0AAW0TI66_SCYPA